jgi:hypothetical protein
LRLARRGAPHTIILVDLHRCFGLWAS